MRTRRSWRNQDSLWKALGGKPEPVKPFVGPPERRLMLRSERRKFERELAADIKRDKQRERVRLALAADGWGGPHNEAAS